MKVAIGADHRGFALKKALLAHIWTHEVQWIDCGAFSDARSDYPVFGHGAVQEIFSGNVERAVLVCGTGAGMAMVANRYRGIFAAVVWSPDIARMVREDDHCNVLVLPADFVTIEEAQACVEAWLCAVPKEGRYVERLNQIDA